MIVAFIDHAGLPDFARALSALISPTRAPIATRPIVNRRTLFLMSRFLLGSNPSTRACKASHHLRTCAGSRGDRNLAAQEIHRGLPGSFSCEARHGTSRPLG